MALTAEDQQRYRSAGWSPFQISILEQIGTGGEMPLATTTTAGLVKKVAATTNAAAATAAPAAGATPTKAEYDALLTDVNALRTKLNELMTNMRATDKVMA